MGSDSRAGVVASVEIGLHPVLEHVLGLKPASKVLHSFLGAHGSHRLTQIP